MTTTLDHRGAIQLLARIFDRLPRLPGADCAGRGELFTSEHPDDQAAAVAICRTCPVLADCQRWVAGLPRSRIPAGVTAGQIHPPRPPGRPRERKPTA